MTTTSRYVRVSCGEEVYFSDPNHSPRRRKSVYVRPTSVKELYLVEDHSYYSSDSEVEVGESLQWKRSSLVRKKAGCTRLVTTK